MATLAKVKPISPPTLLPQTRDHERLLAGNPQRLYDSENMHEASIRQ